MLNIRRFKIEPKIKAIIWGASSIMAVLIINSIILSVLGYPMMAMNILKKYLILFILLILGFGFQVGLFTYFKSLNAITYSTTITSGGISGVSMILCCSHYLLNIMPFIGVTFGLSASAFLTKYTPYFLLIGIISNIIGIGIILYQNKNEKIRE